MFSRPFFSILWFSKCKDTKFSRYGKIFFLYGQIIICSCRRGGPAGCKAEEEEQGAEEEEGADEEQGAEEEQAEADRSNRPVQAEENRQRQDAPPQKEPTFMALSLSRVY